MDVDIESVYRIRVLMPIKSRRKKPGGTFFMSSIKDSVLYWTTLALSTFQ